MAKPTVADALAVPLAAPEPPLGAVVAPDVRYWWVYTAGKPRPGTAEPVDGRRTHHVGAPTAAAATKVVEGIERQHADYYSDKPWAVVMTEPGSQHVEPPVHPHLRPGAGA